MSRVDEAYELLKGRDVWNQAFNKFDNKPLPIVIKFDVSPKSGISSINDYIQKHGLNIDNVRILDQTIRLDGYISYFILYAPPYLPIYSAPVGPTGDNVIGPRGKPGPNGECKPCPPLDSSSSDSSGGSSTSSSFPSSSLSSSSLSSSSVSSSSSSISSSVSSSVSSSSTSSSGASSSSGSTSSSSNSTSSSSDYPSSSSESSEFCVYTWTNEWDCCSQSWGASNLTNTVCTNVMPPAGELVWAVEDEDTATIKVIGDGCEDDEDCPTGDDPGVPPWNGSDETYCKVCVFEWQAVWDCDASPEPEWVVTNTLKECVCNDPEIDPAYDWEEGSPNEYYKRVIGSSCTDDDDCTEPDPGVPEDEGSCYCQYEWEALWDGCQYIVNTTPTNVECVDSCDELDWHALGYGPPDCTRYKTTCEIHAGCQDMCPSGTTPAAPEEIPAIGTCPDDATCWFDFTSTFNCASRTWSTPTLIGSGYCSNSPNIMGVNEPSSLVREWSQAGSACRLSCPGDSGCTTPPIANDPDEEFGDISECGICPAQWTCITFFYAKWNEDYGWSWDKDDHMPGWGSDGWPQTGACIEGHIADDNDNKWILYDIIDDNYYYVWLLWDDEDSACSGDCNCDEEDAPSLPSCDPVTFVMGEEYTC